MVTIEYLARFNETVATAIDQHIEPPLIKYAKLNPNVSLLEHRTDAPAVEAHLGQRLWDLVLIDADHTEEGCWGDYQSVRDNTRRVAFHDISNDICPGVEAVWKRITEVVPARAVCEFTEQYSEGIRRNSYRQFGIGLVTLAT